MWPWWVMIPLEDFTDEDGDGDNDEDGDGDGSQWWKLSYFEIYLEMKVI